LTPGLFWTELFLQPDSFDLPQHILDGYLIYFHIALVLIEVAGCPQLRHFGGVRKKALSHRCVSSCRRSRYSGPNIACVPPQVSYKTAQAYFCLIGRPHSNKARNRCIGNLVQFELTLAIFVSATCGFVLNDLLTQGHAPFTKKAK